MKVDIEVYMGLYLIGVWFIRRSHIFGIMIYWQMLRIRYMLGGPTKVAFQRIGSQIETLLMPAPIKGVFRKVKGMLGYMGDLS